MPELDEDLRRALEELASLERQLARASARAAGKRTEVARLREAIAAEQRSGLPAARTDAILAVLQRGAGFMSPTEILAALHEAGRNDELNSVTATLAHLVRRKDKRVTSPERGRYLAV